MLAGYDESRYRKPMTERLGNVSHAPPARICASPSTKRFTRRLRGVLICLLLPWAALAQDAPKLVPLLNYIAQPFEKDPPAMGYLASRCSALYSIIASKLRRQTNTESQRDAKLYGGLAEKFMGAAVQFKMTGTKLQYKDALTLTSNTVVGLSKLYVAWIDSQKLLTNNMFDDELIETDNDVCMRYAEGFNPG